jgi:hypothetical protein
LITLDVSSPDKTAKKKCGKQSKTSERSQLSVTAKKQCNYKKARHQKRENQVKYLHASIELAAICSLECCCISSEILCIGIKLALHRLIALIWEQGIQDRLLITAMNLNSAVEGGF